LHISCKSFIENLSYDYLPHASIKSPMCPSRLLVAPGKPLSDEVARMLRNPLVSPIFGDFSGCASMLIQAGGKEMLYDDIEAFVNMVAEQQLMSQEERRDTHDSVHSAIVWEPYKDMPHVFHAIPFLAASLEAYESIGRFVRARLEHE
ncbi:hypothetical protein EV182_008125, partial [Spiromyces aspiralis]